MDTLRKSDVVGLARRRGRWCATLTLPLPHGEGAGAEASMLVRDALRDAEEMLLDRGVRGADAAAQVAPLAERAADREFWREPACGLAAYLSPPEPCVFRVARSLRPRTFVGERHLVLPLLPLLDPPERFYVLVLEKGAVRLIRASHDEAVEVPLREEVSSLAGAGSEADLEVSLREVDEEVAARLRGDEVPVVLAGDAALLTTFRAVSRLANLAEGAAPGIAGAASADDLRRRAAAILDLETAAHRGAAVAACREILEHGGSRACDTLAAVVRAAVAGRVATLLVAEDARRYGTFDRASGDVVLRDTPRGGDDDLVDLAAAQTFLQRGAVHIVAAAEIPGGAPAAAILRY